MKIAIVVNEFPALSETFILNHIIGLMDLGLHVDIYSRYKLRGAKVHKEVERRQLLKNTFYFCVPEKRKKRIFKALKIILKYSIKYPFLISRCFYRLKKKSVYDVSTKLIFLEPFLLHDYDIIHCHFGSVGNDFLFLKDIFGSRLKFITSFHGHDATRYPRLQDKRIYDGLFQRCDVIIANSQYIKQILVNLGCKEEKIFKLFEGLNVTKFKFRHRKYPADGNVNIMTAARLVEKKGIDYSIKAVAKVIKSYPNVSYFIAGDGPLTGKLQQLIVNSGFADNIKLLGPMNHDELLELYDKSHIFVLASVTACDGNQEGQGLVLQEAQAVGLPVIATYHNGIPEGVAEGKSGFLVPEKDVDALAERIFYLIRHPGLWPEMGEFGRRFVEENFDSVKIIRELYEIYKIKLTA